MNIGLDFDVHVKNSIFVTDSVLHKKSQWNKLIKNTAKSVETSTELIRDLANCMYSK